LNDCRRRPYDSYSLSTYFCGVGRKTELEEAGLGSGESIEWSVNSHYLEPLRKVGHVCWEPGPTRDEAHKEHTLRIRETLEDGPKPLNELMTLVHFTIPKREKNMSSLETTNLDGPGSVSARITIPNIDLYRILGKKMLL
jgi:hypothetical protein